MENFETIEWLNVSPRGNTKALNDLEITVNLYSSKKKQQSSGYVAFSKHLTEKYKNFKKIRVGKLQGKIIFQMNDDDGFTFCKTNNMLARISSLVIAGIIFENYGVVNEKTVRFEVAEIGNNMLIITKKV